MILLCQHMTLTIKERRCVSRLYLPIEKIAEVCHETNRAYCRVIGDNSQPHWDDAPEWQKASAINGVTNILNGTIKSPRQSHENWLELKKKEGWIWGAVKNPDTREHPCMVEYDELPQEQRVKDTLFFFVTETLANKRTK